MLNYNPGIIYQNGAKFARKAELYSSANTGMLYIDDVCLINNKGILMSTCDVYS